MSGMITSREKNGWELNYYFICDVDLTDTVWIWLKLETPLSYYRANSTTKYIQFSVYHIRKYRYIFGITLHTKATGLEGLEIDNSWATPKISNGERFLQWL